MKSEIKKIESFEDFKNVYMVFSEKPYEEKYTEEDIREIYDDYLENGIINGAYLNGKCIGLIAILKGKRKGQPVEFDKEDDEIAYLSDIAVIDKYRKLGVGTRLVIDALLNSKREGKKIMYMRTLEEGRSMSYGIARKVGFEVIPGVTQLVETTNIYDKKQVNNNIFLSIDLNSLNKDKIMSLIRYSTDDITYLKPEERDDRVC